MNEHDPYEGMPPASAPEPMEDDDWDEGEDPCGERALELRNDAWAKEHTSYEEEQAEREGWAEWDYQMDLLRKEAEAKENQSGPQPF